jgi:peptidoglycan/LPS O-acetylase OafA/YrhL
VPAYYVFLLFVLLVVPFFDGLSVTAQVDQLRDIQFWFWTYLVNVGSSVRAFNVTVPIVHAHFWSLAVEEQFYLVWPLVVLAFGRRTLMGVCIVLAVGALVFRIALTEGFASGVLEPNAAGVLMPARMDTLALGALIALAARGNELKTLARFAPAAALIAGAAIVGLFIRNERLLTLDPSVQTLGYTSFAVLYAAFLVIALGAAPGSLLFRFLTQPALALFGRYSYAMYVVHMLVSFGLATQFIAHDMTPLVFGSQFATNVVFVACAMAMTLGISWVSWRVIERPFLRLKSRFTFERARGEDQAAVVEQVTAPASAS